MPSEPHSSSPLPASVPPWNGTKAAWEGGKRGRRLPACFLCGDAAFPPSLPLSLRRRQRCLRPLNPALERERTKEGENEGDRKEEDRQGREGGRKERKLRSLLGSIVLRSDSPPLRSFSRRLIASVGPSDGRVRRRRHRQIGRISILGR